MRQFFVESNGQYKKVTVVFDCDNGKRAYAGRGFDFEMWRKLPNYLDKIRIELQKMIDVFCERNNTKEVNNA